MVGRHSFARCGGHSLAQQTSSSGCSCSPMFAFQAVCVFARCKEAAELCSCCVPEQGEGTIGTGNMELSCPVPPAHHSVPGAVLVGTTAVLLGTAVCLVLMVVTADGDSRGEKGENVCSDVLQSVAVLWYPAHSGASNSSLHAALSGCSDGLGYSHHQDLPGTLSFVGFSWLMPLQSPGSFSRCVTKRGCGGRIGWSRQVHSQVYSPWLSVSQIRRDQEQQTPVGGGGDVYCLLEPRLGSLARQPLAQQGLHLPQ